MRFYFLSNLQESVADPAQHQPDKKGSLQPDQDVATMWQPFRCNDFTEFSGHDFKEVAVEWRSVAGIWAETH